VTTPVLTAGVAPEFEASLVATFSRSSLGVEVVRRCVDVAELLAVGSAGVARAALVAASLRHLDRDVLTRLAVAGVGVVGVVETGDDEDARRLGRLGVTQVLAGDATPEHVAEALLAAAGSAPVLSPYDVADPLVALPQQPVSPTGDVERAVGAGRVIAVWGPTGAPGRSSIALAIAAELAEADVSAMLVDADGYGGVVAQLLGLLDESPGVAAACRLANTGSLDAESLAQLALQVRPHLRVLTGIARAHRWPELRAAAMEVVLEVARSLVAVTVVDCGFCLERDEELSFDTAAPRRNGATLAALAAADTVVVVGSGDPVGLQRLVRGVVELADAVPTTAPLTVVNRVRSTALGGGDSEREIAAALGRFGGLRDVRFVPMDVAAFDAAIANGRTLAEAAPMSPARLALQRITADLAGLPPPRARRRLAVRRR